MPDQAAPTRELSYTLDSYDILVFQGARGWVLDRNRFIWCRQRCSDELSICHCHDEQTTEVPLRMRSYGSPVRAGGAGGGGSNTMLVPCGPLAGFPMVPIPCDPCFCSVTKLSSIAPPPTGAKLSPHGTISRRISQQSNYSWPFVRPQATQLPGGQQNEILRNTFSAMPPAVIPDTMGTIRRA